MSAPASLPPLPYGLRRDVGGTVTVPEDALRARLGDTPFWVWSMLCDVRNARGLVALSREEMTRTPGWERFGFRSVRKALAQLETAGLVLPGTWTPPSKDRARGRSTVAVVPKDVAGWLAMASPKKRGGARPGAGRPRTSPPKEPRRTAEDVLREATERAARTRLGTLPWESKGAAVPASKGANSKISSSLLPLPEEEFFPKGKNSPRAGATARVFSSFERETTTGARLRPVAPLVGYFGAPEEPTVASAGLLAARVHFKRSPELPEALYAPVEEQPRVPAVSLEERVRRAARLAERAEEIEAVDPSGGLGALGSVLCGTAAPRVSLTANYVREHKVIPSFTPVALFSPAIPPPPKLDPNETPQRHAYLLSAWYTGAMEAKFGVRCWTFARGPITKNRNYRALVLAAVEFIKQETSPAAWCAWCADVWDQYAKEKAKPGAKKPKSPFPPVAWVFSPKRIEERRGWFHKEMTDYAGGRVVYTPAGRELLEKQAAMRMAFRAMGPVAAEDAAVVVAEIFPEGFDSLLARAKREAEAVKAQYQHDVETGRWLWQ